MEEKEVRRLAIALGIDARETEGLAALIQAIHDKEGELPCFSSPWSAPCHIEDCPYAEECSSSICNDEMSLS